MVSGKVLGHAGDQRIGVSHVHHHRAENIAIVDQRLGFLQGHAAPLPQAEQFLNIGFAKLRRGRIDDLHAFEIHAEFAGSGLNLGRIPQQDRHADLFFHQRVAGAQDLFVVSLGKHHLFGIGLRLVDHRARDFVGFAEPALQLIAVGIEIDRFLGDSGAHGGFGHGRGLPDQHARIEGLGDQVVAAELQALARHRRGRRSPEHLLSPDRPARGSPPASFLR